MQNICSDEGKKPGGDVRVLGIESSCDETGVAIYCSEQGLLAHALYSQIALHQEYGGVVPELASRDHVRKLVPLTRQVFADAALSWGDVDAVVYTQGPGLAGALMVGAAFANGLAFAWGKPVFPVHHMEGHLLASMLESVKPDFPFVALLVSGGHTLLAEVRGLGEYRILGESLDDAAGEAFDKTAKIMGLGYPGGPLLSALAEQGDCRRFVFARPMTDRPGLEFSFSGLKTAALTAMQECISEQDRADLAASFQEAVVDTLYIKSRRALEQTGLKRLVVAGGVGANKRLRAKLAELMERCQGEIFYPRLEFCTDNGAMIALAGALRLQLAEQQSLESVSATSGAFRVKPRWSIEELSVLA